MGLNLDYLVDCIWDKLELVRVYTKRRGRMYLNALSLLVAHHFFFPSPFLILSLFSPSFPRSLVAEPPDFQDALIMRAGCTVETICRSLHRDLVKEFKYANVWVCLLDGERRGDEGGRGEGEGEERDYSN